MHNRFDTRDHLPGPGRCRIPPCPYHNNTWDLSSRGDGTGLGCSIVSTNIKAIEVRMCSHETVSETWSFLFCVLDQIAVKIDAQLVPFV